MSYKQFGGWQKSMQLVLVIYEVTITFPTEERYGLVAQMRRSAVSIPSNIAEGYRRGTRREYLRFLRIAFASGGELETQLILSVNLGYLESRKHQMIESKLSEVMMIINATIKRIS